MEDAPTTSDPEDPLPPAADTLIARVRETDLPLHTSPKRPRTVSRLGRLTTRRLSRTEAIGGDDQRLPLAEQALIAELGRISRVASRGIQNRTRTA